MLCLSVHRTKPTKPRRGSKKKKSKGMLRCSSFKLEKPKHITKPVPRRDKGREDLTQNIRQFVREYKKELGTCADCKEPCPPFILEFDHIDPETKRFNIGNANSVPSMEALLVEIDKCDLVCSNCHKLREHARGLR